MYIVDSEFAPSPKFKGFLIGNVKRGEVVEMLSLNKSSYAKIAEVFGKDTSEWIGKTISYDGEHQLGAMKGKLFMPVLPF